MQIRRITFQGGQPEQGLYSKDYAQHFAEDIGDEYVRKVKRLQYELLRHLEGLDGPPTWVCTSQADLVLYNADSNTYGNASDSLRVSAVTLAYDVYCPLPESEHPWHEAIGYAQNVEEAGALVLDGLRRVASQSQVK